MNDRIKAVIIEDEIPAARVLRSLVVSLRPDWDVEVIPGNIEDASAWFRRNPFPDVMFLDIQLSDGTSFDLLAREKPDSAIIFTTAYDEYAVRAFSVESIDYILKPVDTGRLEEAIRRFEMYSGRQSRPEDYLDVILDTLRKKEKRYRTRFLIPEAGRYISLRVEDIAYFYTENKTSLAVTSSGQTHVVDMSLSRLEEQLDPDMFFRANRQVLVGFRSIAGIEPYFNGKLAVKVNPPFRDNITVSEEKVTQFKMWLDY